MRWSFKLQSSFKISLHAFIIKSFMTQFKQLVNRTRPAHDVMCAVSRVSIMTSGISQYSAQTEYIDMASLNEILVSSK